MDGWIDIRNRGEYRYCLFGSYSRVYDVSWLAQSLDRNANMSRDSAHSRPEPGVIFAYTAEGEIVRDRTLILP